jgi:uncharacterized membrane protein YeaQ/YmgE (transglycosylase-associated protein family)
VGKLSAPERRRPADVGQRRLTPELHGALRIKGVRRTRLEAVELLIIVLVAGLFVGALGRLIIPGPNPMSILGTIGAGIGGAIIGGIVGAYFGVGAGLVLSVIGAAFIVWWVERGRARRAGML